MRHRRIVWIATAGVIAIGVALLACHFLWVGTGKLLHPWDKQSDLSLVRFKQVSTIEVEGYSNVTGRDGAVGSIKFHNTYRAGAGRDLFEVRISRPAWLLWWDDHGEPQNALQADRPAFVAGSGLPTRHPWAVANSVGLTATVPPGAYPLHIMILEPGKIAQDKARVQKLIDQALDRQLSDDQVAQILEIAQELGSLDAHSAQKLKDISIGKIPLQVMHLLAQRVDDTKSVSTLSPAQAENSNTDYARLKSRISQLLSILRPSTAMDARLTNYTTAVAAYNELKANGGRTPRIAKLLHQAAVMAPDIRALEIAACIDEIDPIEGARTYLDLMLHQDPEVRDHARMDHWRPWMAEALGHDFVKSKFDSITDPRIRAQWMKDVVPDALPEIISRQRTAQLLKKPGRLDPASKRVKDLVLECAKADDIESLKSLIDRGARIDFPGHIASPGGIGQSPCKSILPEVASAGAAKSVAFLLDQHLVGEANLAMEMAIRSNRIEVAKVLLEWGVSPQALNSNHNSLLSEATMSNRPEIAQLMKEYENRKGTLATQSSH